MKHFLGFANFYRLPTVPFPWSPNSDKAFSKPKTLSNSSALGLILPDPPFMGEVTICAENAGGEERGDELLHKPQRTTKVPF